MDGWVVGWMGELVGEEWNGFFLVFFLDESVEVWVVGLVDRWVDGWDGLVNG